MRPSWTGVLGGALEGLARGRGPLLSAPAADPAVARAVAAAAARHREIGWTQEPARAHPTPPAMRAPRLARASLATLPGAEHLRFESGHEPVDPEIRAAYLGVRANRTAHAFLWRHRTPRPAIVCVHGSPGGRIGLDARTLQAGWLHATLGLDVVCPVLPLHGVRAGGAGLAGHPLVVNAALAQAVVELRQLVAWLRAQGAPAVGILGHGLGGTLAALLASLERRLAAVVPVAPLASLADHVLRDLSPEARSRLAAAGLTRGALEDAWAPHAVLRHEVRVAREARLLVAGQADRVAGADQVRALHEHWGRPALHWHPGSHLLPLARRSTRERLARHLDATLRPAARPLPLTRFRSSLPRGDMQIGPEST